MISSHPVGVEPVVDGASEPSPSSSPGSGSEGSVAVDPSAAAIELRFRDQSLEALLDLADLLGEPSRGQGDDAGLPLVDGVLFEGEEPLGEAPRGSRAAGSVQQLARSSGYGLTASLPGCTSKWRCGRLPLALPLSPT